MAIRRLPGNADVPVGALPADPGAGWYSRGYLPHRDLPCLLQSITYRLSDSLPQAKLEQLEDDLRALPAKGRDASRRARIEA